MQVCAATISQVKRVTNISTYIFCLYNSKVENSLHLNVFNDTKLKY